MSLEFDAAGHQVDRVRIGSCRNDDFAKDHSVSGSKLSLRLAPGRYFFELVCDGGSAHGVGSFACDGGVRALRLVCDAWEPGPASVDVVVRDAGSRGIANAGVRLRRRSDAGDALPTAIHEQSTDSSGLARFVGLAGGVYDLQITHPGHTPLAMRIRVASAPETQLAEVSLREGKAVFLDLIHARGQMATQSLGIAYRAAGNAWWTPVETGPGMDLVADGVPVGEMEVLVVAEGCAGVTTRFVGGGSDRLVIPLEQVSPRSVRLVDSRGAPTLLVSATLELPGTAGDWPVHAWPVDSDGRVSFFPLGVAGEKFVVRHLGRVVMALDPAFVPEVLPIGDLGPKPNK
jgi:hypothetical protein